MTNNIFVINEKLFSLLNDLLDTSRKLHMQIPYYSVTDNGQRIALYWQNVSPRSIEGSLTIQELVLFQYDQDIPVGDKHSWRPPNDMYGAMKYVMEYLEHGLS